MSKTLSREQRAAVISEGLALVVFNDDNVRTTLVADVIRAIINDTGWQRAADAIAAYKQDPNDFVWESSAALSVRDRLWALWGMGEVMRDNSSGSILPGAGGSVVVSGDLAHQTLASICDYDDTVLWQTVARDLMPTPEVVARWAVSTGLVDASEVE